MIQLNITSLAQLTKLFGLDMVKRKKGYILNVASLASFQPGPLMSLYCASKHFVLALSESIANEWNEYGVKVTSLCPGVTESEFQENAGMYNSKLVHNKKLMSAKSVAQYGYKAMERGKIVAIPGLYNKVLATSVRFVPRRLVSNIVRYMQKEIKIN